MRSTGAKYIYWRGGGEERKIFFFKKMSLKRKRSEENIFTQVFTENLTCANQAVTKNLELANQAMIAWYSMLRKYERSSAPPTQANNTSSTSASASASTPVLPSASTSPLLFASAPAPALVPPPPPPPAMASASVSINRNACTICSSPDHYRYVCDRVPPFLRYNCYRCWLYGHKAAHCTNQPRDLFAVLLELGYTIGADGRCINVRDGHSINVEDGHNINVVSGNSINAEGRQH